MMSSDKSRPYRSRLIRPCDACRRRRIACVRANIDDNCSLCLHRGQNCTFENAPPTRWRARQFASRQRPSPAAANIEGSSTSNYRMSTSITDGTVFSDRTCLYSGSSSDQHPQLLRHLVYDDAGCFGDDLWTVRRISNQESAPSFMTVYPNSHMDCHAQMYSLERVKSIFSPYEDELIRLYYAHVHPSYPILELQDIFQQNCARRVVPASLMAVVCNLGAQFWHFSPLSTEHGCPLQREIRPWIFSCLTLEARTPNLAVVKAFLLFMQMIPQQIRPPNHPGFWPMTTMLIGMAQDIGLHVDPTSWNISPTERKTRRILWWAVYMHDKWMSHILGRPSHISDQSWNVKALTMNDFSDDFGRLPVEAISSANAFISLCSLTSILADVSDSFYSIRAEYERSPAEDIVSKAQNFQAQVQRWKAESPSSLAEGASHSFTTALAGLSVCLTIQRATFNALTTQFDTDSDATLTAAEIISTVRHAFFSVLSSLENAHPRPKGMWLSYIRGTLTMIGSLLITLVLSSVKDADLEERRALLIEYWGFLKRFTEVHERDGLFEFARLPLRRLKLIMGQLFGEEELQRFVTTPASVDETDVSYTPDEETAMAGFEFGHH